jgi:hypothetical protein
MEKVKIIKARLKQIGFKSVDCIQVVQDRIKRWYVVYRGMSV